MKLLFEWFNCFLLCHEIINPGNQVIINSAGNSHSPFCWCSIYYHITFSFYSYYILWLEACQDHLSIPKPSIFQMASACTPATWQAWSLLLTGWFQSPSRNKLLVAWRSEVSPPDERHAMVKSGPASPLRLHWMLLHLDLRSNHYEFRLSQVYVIGSELKFDLRSIGVGLALLCHNGSELKFYNLHQTLNTSINALNSFTDIYLISSAKSGFVFFISFTSFFLTFISYNNLFTISCQACRLQLAACCLLLVAWAPNPPTHL